MTSYITAELRRQVIERAGNCCEYCLLSQKTSFFKFAIDHIIAEKHGGANTEDNLCLSCPDCNSFKGSDIASIDHQTSQLTYLFHPRQQEWTHHFQLNDAIIEPLTPEGRVTIAILRLNDVDRIVDRTLFMQANLYPCNS